MDHNIEGKSLASYTLEERSKGIAEVRDNSVREGSGDGHDRDERR